MGDLRDTQGDAGVWARIMNGTGSADGDYSDNYTHVQIGVDRKHELDGVDLFTGALLTYTDSNASSHAFSGKTNPWVAVCMPLHSLIPELILT